VRTFPEKTGLGPGKKSLLSQENNRDHLQQLPLGLYVRQFFSARAAFSSAHAAHQPNVIEPGFRVPVLGDYIPSDSFCAANGAHRS
jgi:hypothetical protein